MLYRAWSFNTQISGKPSKQEFSNHDLWSIDTKQAYNTAPESYFGPLTAKSVGTKQTTVLVFSKQ